MYNDSMIKKFIPFLIECIDGKQVRESTLLQPRLTKVLCSYKGTPRVSVGIISILAN